MQVNESLSDGLKREFKVVVSNKDFESAVDQRLLEISKTADIKGFRPGKVPMTIIKQKYRSSIMGEVLQQTVQESAQNVITDKSLRPAMQPNIEVTSFEEGKDLEFKLGLELLPDFEVGELESIKLERLTTTITDQLVNDALKRISDAEKKYETIEETRGALKGDAILIDFQGELEDGSTEGLKGDDFELELGSNSFIPGFEDQLIDVKAGENRTLSLTFPENYPHPESAGKNATFEISVKEIRSRIPSIIDDEMATRHGFKDLTAMTEGVKERLKLEFQSASQAKLKRALLDQLADRYTFDVPPGLVEQEFEQIWNQVKADVEKADKPFEEVTGETEEEAEKDYRNIATRRVRLGLVLSELGQQNSITVSQQDLVQAAMAQASQVPNQEQVVEFYRSNPQALERFQAPVYEDKVVTFITELAKVEDREVSQEELFSDPEDGTENTKKETKKKLTSSKQTVKKKAPRKKVKKPQEKVGKTESKKKKTTKIKKTNTSKDTKTTKSS